MPSRFYPRLGFWLVASIVVFLTESITNCGIEQICPYNERYTNKYIYTVGRFKMTTGGESQNAGTLSDRELQIVELVAGGLTNQEIAEKLEISKRTVDNHISNILTKTATGNRVALVRWALQWGKVCIDEVNCCTLPIARDDLKPEETDWQSSEPNDHD